MDYNSCRKWITILVETKPIDNEEDVSKFVDILKAIPGVRYAQGIYEFPAKPDEINMHLYGGKRSKK